MSHVQLLACLAFAACNLESDASSSGRWRGSVDTLAAGAIHVRNAGAGAWTEQQRWRIVEDLRIGAEQGGGPDQFGQVAAVASSAEGHVLVADGFTQEIRVFERDGTYQRRFGRKGSGPGELARISGIAVDGHGRIWVADPGNRRYTVFDRDGVHVGQRRMLVPGVVFPWLGGFDADGRLYDAVPVAESHDRIGFRYFRADSSTGELVDSFPALGSAPLRPVVPAAVFWLIPRLTFRFDPHGYFWFGTTDRYRIVQRAWSGDTIRIIELERPAVAVTEMEKDSIMRVAPEGSAPFLTFTRRDIPAVKPAFERIYVDDAGHLIVQPSVAAGDQGRIFDVFDREGRYLGEATSNVRFVAFPALPQFQARAVLGVTVDSLGIEYVVRARIESR